MTPTPEAARAFLEDAAFVWHQHFELVPGVWTPGVSPIDWLCHQAGVPTDLTGLTVLDIGTTNAGTAFEMERRGADRVVAVDIFDAEWFGVRPLIEFLGSRVQFVQATVYELADRFPEPFDLVICWGVLYHLRHPLLALDNLRAVTGGEASLETAVCDGELPEIVRGQALTRFYRQDELAKDGSNWFAPTVASLEDWVRSCGFDSELIGAWPPEAPERAMVRLRSLSGPAEYEGISYEKPLRATPWQPRSSGSV
jgi:tRNA (mo5U34)-methyltransferase